MIFAKPGMIAVQLGSTCLEDCQLSCVGQRRHSNIKHTEEVDHCSCHLPKVEGDEMALWCLVLLILHGHSEWCLVTQMFLGHAEIVPSASGVVYRSHNYMYMYKCCVICACNFSLSLPLLVDVSCLKLPPSGGVTSRWWLLILTWVKIFKSCSLPMNVYTSYCLFLFLLSLSVYAFLFVASHWHQLPEAPTLGWCDEWVMVDFAFCLLSLFSLSLLTSVAWSSHAQVAWRVADGFWFYILKCCSLPINV